MKNSNGEIYRQTLIYGSEHIECMIQFDDRENLKIIVYPDQTVFIKAPSPRSIPQVLEKLKKRAAWIIKQLNYFDQFRPRSPEPTYVSGESFYYLGRQYRLKVIQDATENVKLIGRYIRVQTSDKNDTVRVKALLDKWYKQHAETIFNRRLDICHESAKRYNINRPEFKLRSMKKRWGSCNISGGILLNTQLVRAPLRCIDYVIIHELCHLKYPAHSDKFFRLLTRLLPDWKERKERLEYVTP